MQSHIGPGSDVLHVAFGSVTEEEETEWMSGLPPLYPTIPSMLFLGPSVGIQNPGSMEGALGGGAAFTRVIHLTVGLSDIHILAASAARNVCKPPPPHHHNHYYH